MPRTLVLTVATLTIACAHPHVPVSEGHPLVGRPLPQIHRRTALDGRPIDASQFNGRRVLVKFFADYCKPCMESLPAAERVHEAHPDVLFVGVDEDETDDVARSVVQRFGLTFPVLRDADNILSGRFRVTSMPTTFVADASGMIRWVGGEGQSEADLGAAVDACQ